MVGKLLPLACQKQAIVGEWSVDRPSAEHSSMDRPFHAALTPTPSCGGAGAGHPRGDGAAGSAGSTTTTTSTTASSTHNTVAVLVTTICLEVGRNAVVRVVGKVRGGIEANLDPGKETVIEVVTQIDVLGERVVGTVGLQHAPHVVRIRGDGLSVGVVRVGIFHCAAQHFVPEELANVRHAAGAYLQSLVRKQSSVQMGQQVGVSRTSVVVTREDGLEFDYTVAVGLLNTTQVSRVPSVGGVVARRRNTTTLGSDWHI